MLGKCVNPVCLAPFRKLGDGKLFAFESRSRSPVFFWLCECCGLSFTLRLDSHGQLTLQRVPDGVRVTIFDGHPLGQMG